MTAIECHCGKDGHPLNSINCPVHGSLGNYAAVGHWHCWYAWRPVRTEAGRWRWLRFVQRQQCRMKAHFGMHAIFFWRYADPWEKT